MELDFFELFFLPNVFSFEESDSANLEPLDPFLIATEPKVFLKLDPVLVLLSIEPFFFKISEIVNPSESTLG